MTGLPLVLGGAALVFLAFRAARLDGAAQAGVNALLGLLALLAVNLTAVHTGVRLGFNLFNGLVAGVLGVPGVVLLVLVQWVFA